MTEIVLIAERVGCNTRGQLFDGIVEGRRIVTRSTTPLCDAARALLAAGADPAAPLVMRHAGKDRGALRSTVGVAAKLTVKDDSGGKPVSRRWSPSPFDGRSAVPVRPPMRRTGVAAGVVAAS